MSEFKKLIDVKSIITISLTLAVMYLALKGIYDIKEIYIVIISFYFGTQHQKREDDSNG